MMDKLFTRCCGCGALVVCRRVVYGLRWKWGCRDCFGFGNPPAPSSDQETR